MQQEVYCIVAFYPKNNCKVGALISTLSVARKESPTQTTLRKQREWEKEKDLLGDVWEDQG